MIKYRKHLNKLLPKNPVTVELGVAEGFFSADIVRDWNSSIHYAVDNWSPIGSVGDGSFPQEWHTKNYENAVKRFSQFGDKITILRGPTYRMSQHVKNETCDLVYVDADHSYEGVKRDIESWWPKLKRGGIMAFHDYESIEYGVKQAVTEFANSKGLQINLIPEDKTEDAGAWIKK